MALESPDNLSVCSCSPCSDANREVILIKAEMKPKQTMEVPQPHS